jgi:hypothetical protein
MRRRRRLEPPDTVAVHVLPAAAVGTYAIAVVVFGALG